MNTELNEVAEYVERFLEQKRLLINRYNRNLYHSSKLREALTNINVESLTKVKIKETITNLIEKNRKAR